MYDTQTGRSAPAPAPAGTATRVASDLFANLTRAVRGKPDQLRLALAALLSGGHLLIEDIPGVGKTLLAKALARSIGGRFRRIQGTPDLLPADLTGVAVYRRGTENWEFHPGPLFANVVLVDEINRATPRTQSALLEAMEERQVTVDGETHALPDPFFLIATQNPFEHAGTFPLVEGQRDRFGVVLELGLPGREAERELLLGHGGVAELGRLEPVASPQELRRAVNEAAATHCDPAVAEYVLDLVEATRSHPDITLGASPRASLGLLQVARAHATVSGRNFVTPDDVKAVAAPALAHRVLVAGSADLHAAGVVVTQLLLQLAVPRG